MKNLALALAAFAGLSTAGVCFGSQSPEVAPKFAKFFYKYSADTRNPIERILDAAGWSDDYPTRSIALVAGVFDYPSLPLGQRTLDPAQEDLRQVSEHLADEQLFDEVILLPNESVSFENLEYFLQYYIPSQLERFPRSRFLFAYSGHGFRDDDERGYLLQSDAQHSLDVEHALSLKVLSALLERPVAKGHHVLVLINACYGGSFFRRAPFGVDYLPNGRGAHAITSSGAEQISIGDPRWGPGSVFFESFLEGLRGRADVSPKSNGDGFVTVQELSNFISSEVRLATQGGQTPIPGDLLPEGSTGGLYFLNSEKHTVRASSSALRDSSFFSITDAATGTGSAYWGEAPQGILSMGAVETDPATQEARKLLENQEVPRDWVEGRKIELRLSASSPSRVSNLAVVAVWRIVGESRVSSGATHMLLKKAELLGEIPGREVHPGTLSYNYKVILPDGRVGTLDNWGRPYTAEVSSKAPVRGRF